LIREARIVKIYFGNPGYAAQKDILETGLGGSSHRDRIAIAAKAGRNPEHSDFGEWWSLAIWRRIGCYFTFW
jgi:hypothetical protein